MLKFLLFFPNNRQLTLAKPLFPKLKDSPNFSLNNFDSEYSLDNFKIHPLNSNNLKLFPTKNSFAVSNTDYNRKLLNQGTQSHFAELFFNKDQSSYFLFFDFFGSLVPKIEDYEIDFQEVVIFNAASVKKRCLLRGEEDRKGALEFGSDFEWRQISRRQKKEVVEEGDEDEENVEELENVETADELDRTLWDPEDWKPTSLKVWPKNPDQKFLKNLVGPKDK